MKVYIVSWFDGEGDNLDKVFSDETTADKYVIEKNKKSFFEWSYVGVEVET